MSWPATYRAFSYHLWSVFPSFPFTPAHFPSLSPFCWQIVNIWFGYTNFMHELHEPHNKTFSAYLDFNTFCFRLLSDHSNIRSKVSPSTNCQKTCQSRFLISEHRTFKSPMSMTSVSIYLYYWIDRDFRYVKSCLILGSRVLLASREFG